MPHLVILYTPNLEAEADMTALCRKLADIMLETLDEAGKQVFPTGGTRVLAYPAAHYAVADGKGDYGFIYLNVRMAAGRSDATKKRAGDALLAGARDHFGTLFERQAVGMTLQIDESPGQVYDGKHSSLHPLFNKI
ncbi:5-carboxymethyl-2-hydroxymuconate Delta-isomerase [Polaromonas eurypsychrophila]|uniref:5-carboxymethyl-2-hydroxymuconate isomerase n=1 Tax=Polaromonas eurypsychrophila TaxID=1614635 RepID=A0A916S9Q2_9BURK|nr:5-carboxymethyl-2-hydroxymuconate Delta-isomerase [Polaromonas eurypsychrophila]GGA87646.1 5-carboxymethyl-2-hydroxymuconate isomerase [Polaromonas eurypsychrophila]